MRGKVNVTVACPFLTVAVTAIFANESDNIVEFVQDLR